MVHGVSLKLWHEKKNHSEILFLNVKFLYRKARKRDRECMGSDNERKLYLQDPLLELRIPETEINFLLDLPGGLDYNEWLASHSKL